MVDKLHVQKGPTTAEPEFEIKPHTFVAAPGYTVKEGRAAGRMQSFFDGSGADRPRRVFEHGTKAERG